MIKKISIIVALLLCISGVFAGTWSESAGSPTFDGELMCVAGIEQTYDFSGSVFNSVKLTNVSSLNLTGDIDMGGNIISDVGVFNNVYYVEAGNASDVINKIDLLNDGDTLYIPCGIYQLGTNKLYINKDINIYGYGECTILNSSYNNVEKLGAIYVSNVNRIKISNFKLILNTNRVGIRIQNVSYSSFYNLNIISTLETEPAGEYFAIQAEDLSNSYIYNNEITGKMWDTAIRLDTINDGDIFNSNNQIYHNNIHDLGNDIWGDSQSTGTAIEIESEGSNSSNLGNSITDNMIYNIDGHGIRMNRCTDCIVTDNKITNVGHSGIWISSGYNSSIQSNYITNSTQEDIEIWSDNNFISNNYLKDGNTYPIRINSGNNNRIESNFILNNDNNIINQGTNTTFNNQDVNGEYILINSGEEPIELENGLVLYYAFDSNGLSSNSSRIYDSSINNIDALIRNDSNWSIGKYFSGFSFDGYNDDIIINPTSKLNFTSVTYNMWFYENNDISTQHMLQASANYFTIRRTDSNEYRCKIRNSIGTTYELAVIDNLQNNTWNMFTCIVDWENFKMKIYINGLYIDDLTIAGSPKDYSSSSWYIGSDGTGNYYNSSLDELMIYNKILDKRQIKSLYYGFRPQATGHLALK